MQCHQTRRENADLIDDEYSSIDFQLEIIELYLTMRKYLHLHETFFFC